MLPKQSKKQGRKIPGAVCVQWVRCGRAGCKCASDRGHGPYYYRFWREHGRLRKKYVPLAQVEQVRAACLAYKVQRQNERVQFKAALDLLRELRAPLRGWAYG